MNCRSVAAYFNFFYIDIIKSEVHMQLNLPMTQLMRAQTFSL